MTGMVFDIHKFSLHDEPAAKPPPPAPPAPLPET